MHQEVCAEQGAGDAIGDTVKRPHFDSGVTRLYQADARALPLPMALALTEGAQDGT
jgi:hypothetical protein